MITWNEYLELFKSPRDISDYAPLSIGSTEHLREPDPARMFEHTPQYDELLRRYDIPQFSAEKTVFGRSLAIMNWLTENTSYCGMQEKMLRDDTLDILDFSVGNGFECAINCRYKAIALTDMLIARGIKAYPIALTSGEADRVSCHFIVHVYLDDEERWVVLDPSFNTYFTDDSGAALNVFKLRELMLSGKKPHAVGYNFNGTKECEDIYITYFIGLGLTNIATWNDNSNDRRNEANMYYRKEFETKLPNLNI